MLFRKAHNGQQEGAPFSAAQIQKAEGGILLGPVRALRGPRARPDIWRRATTIYRERLPSLGKSEHNVKNAVMDPPL